MKKSELTAMATFFRRLTELNAYLDQIRTALAETPTCDCEIGTAGVYRLRGRCVPAGPGLPPPDMCLTVGHLAARLQLEQLKLPVAHLSDPQLDTVVEQLAALVLRAPDLTQRRFVIDLQAALRASLLPLAQPEPTNPAAEPSSEETTTP
jgi:hypothetical protein